MKRLLSALMSAVLLISVISLCACSKDNSDDNALDESPEGYMSISFKDEFYGLSFKSEIPNCESIEVSEQRDGYCVFKCDLIGDSARYIIITAYTGLCDEEGRLNSFSDFEGESEHVEIGGLYSSKIDKTVGASRAIKYNIFNSFLDGYARVTLEINSILDNLSDDEWNSILNAIESYSKFEVLETNNMITDNGNLVDKSRTMAFKDPSKIEGQEAKLKHIISPDLVISASFTLDNIDYVIYAKGDVSESTFNSKAEDTDGYTQCTSRGDTYYCKMKDRFPNVECSVYVELDGVYYNFSVLRNHNLSVAENKEYIEDADNYELFADLVADFISNAKLDTSNYSAS